MEENIVTNEIDEIQTVDEVAANDEKSGNFGAFVIGAAGAATAYLVIKEAKRGVNWAIGKWNKHKLKKQTAATIVDAEIIEEQTVEPDEESQNN